MYIESLSMYVPSASDTRARRKISLVGVHHPRGLCLEVNFNNFPILLLLSFV